MLPFHYYCCTRSHGRCWHLSYTNISLNDWPFGFDDKREAWWKSEAQTNQEVNEERNYHCSFSLITSRLGGKGVLWVNLDSSKVNEVRDPFILCFVSSRD